MIGVEVQPKPIAFGAEFNHGEIWNDERRAYPKQEVLIPVDADTMRSGGDASFHTAFGVLEDDATVRQLAEFARCQQIAIGVRLTFGNVVGVDDDIEQAV